MVSGYSATSKDALTLTGSALLLSPATADFHLTSGSPAVNAATGSTVTDDYEIKARTQPYLGAFEL
jgi:hypothetical protein